MTLNLHQGLRPPKEGTPVDQEQRRFIRFKSRLTVIFHDPGSGKTWRVLTNDLSGAGLLCTMEEPLNPGVTLQGELKLPDQRQVISFTAQVVRGVCRPMKLKGKTHDLPPTWEMAVKFVDIPPQDLKLIIAYAKMHAVP